jgi:hypothetical protein
MLSACRFLFVIYEKKPQVRMTLKKRKKMSDWNYSVPTVVTTSLSKQFKQWQVGSGTKMALPRPGGAAAVPRRLPRRR